MTGGVRLVNRLLLGLLGVLLVGAGAALVLRPDDVRRSADALAGTASGRGALWVGAGAVALLAVLALAWVASQRRGLARTAFVVPAQPVAVDGPQSGLPDEVAPDAVVPGEVVVTSDAVERLLHGLVRADRDVLAASVTAVRSRRGGPRYDVVVAPRRGADPGDVAASAVRAADRAGRLLGGPVAPTVRLRGSAVRRIRRRRRVA